MQRLLSSRPEAGVRLTPSAITALARRAISDDRVVMLTKRNPVVDANMVLVGGTYDHDDELDGEPSIEITMYYHPEQQHLDPADMDWRRISFELAETIGHEMVHREQHRRRRRPRLPRSLSTGDSERDYLGLADEIEAYGFSIAAEMLYLLETTDMDDPRMQDIPNWCAYQRAFAEDVSVLIKLRQQISKYLRRLEVVDNDKDSTD
jgi:hypothetical protein